MHANIVDFGGEIEVLGMRVHSATSCTGTAMARWQDPGGAIRELPAVRERLARRSAHPPSLALRLHRAEQLIAVFRNRRDPLRFPTDARPDEYDLT
jgi:hypothetical protein